MADPVATPAAPPAPAAAPAAPALKENEFLVPFELGDGLDDPPPQDEGDEQEITEETPRAPVDPPPVKPTRLQKFRNADGTLNEALIEQVATAAEEAGATVSEIQRAYNTDPVYRLNYIKWRQGAGLTLTAEQHAELAAQKPAEPPKPAAAPQYTKAQIQTAYDKIYAEQGPAAAQSFWHDMVTAPELKKRDDAIAERDARDAKAREQAENSARIQGIKGELALAAEKYPDLVVADASLPQGFRIMDDAVYAGVAELMSVKKPMLWRIKTVLADLGRANPPPKKSAPPGVKPTVPVSSQRTAPPPRKLKPNEFAVPAHIVGDDGQ